MKGSDTDHRVLVALRVLDILELFEAQGRPMTLQEIARRIGVPQSTTFRLLYTLQDRGYLELDRTSFTYWPSPRIFNIGRIAVLNNRLRQLAAPFLEALHRRFDEQALIAVLAQGHVMYIDIIKPANWPRLGNNIGDIAPAHATALGKSMLAYMTEDEVDELVSRMGLQQRTRRTISTLPALKAELALTRRRGYSINDREQEEDLYAVAAPIFNDQGRVVAAICLSGRPVSMMEKDPELMARALKQTAEQISDRLGWRPDGQPAEDVALAGNGSGRQ